MKPFSYGYFKYRDIVWEAGQPCPISILPGTGVLWAANKEDIVQMHTPPLQSVEQPEERFEAPEEGLDALPQIPHGEVRIVLDLEGALLELPTPEGASATQAWLTVEERAEEGAAISRHRVWITSFPDGSFHVDRILE